jgi:hypothetical protein
MKKPDPSEEHVAVCTAFLELIESVTDDCGWTRGQIGSFLIGIGSHLLCAEVGPDAAIKTLRFMEPVLKQQGGQSPTLDS